MAQQGSWNFASEELRERGALRKEEGDAVREYSVMHEETFLRSWSREDGREKEERTAKAWRVAVVFRGICWRILGQV